MHRVELKAVARLMVSPKSCKFLMHRVELKGVKVGYFAGGNITFLMHRVELKVGHILGTYFYYVPFLMHRVELKVSLATSRSSLLLYQTVPNAPCGVESLHMDYTGSP